MATTKPRNVSKYYNLSNEERKKKYAEKSLEWYNKKTPEEKKLIAKKSTEMKHGKCDICNNGKLYANLPQHRNSKLHIRNMKGKKIIVTKKIKSGKCILCGNDRIYTDLPRHCTSQAHIRNTKNKDL